MHQQGRVRGSQLGDLGAVLQSQREKRMSYVCAPQGPVSLVMARG